MRIALALFLSLVVVNATAQNLVPNPSFEEYLECPYSTAEFQTQVVDWYSFSYTPDYFHVCSNDLEAYAGVPDNGNGFQYPVSGEAYGGFITYFSSLENEREYIACQLIEPLEIDEDYYTMFYISMCDHLGTEEWVCASNHVGAKFFLNPEYGPDEPDNYIPQNTADVEYNEMITDSTNWILVEGWFTADQAYDWVAFGNFYDDQNTDTIQLANPEFCLAGVYIDNVCISKDPQDCEYLTSIEDPIPEVSNFMLFPNPAKNNLFLKSDKKINSIIIYDLLGNLIYRRNDTAAKKIQIGTSKWASGMYTLKVAFEDGQVEQHKFIKK